MARFLSGRRDSSCFLLAVTILWTLLYARHGFSNWDEGFVSGLSWRVSLGQVPYLDFLYIRPPRSPLLHALPMLLVPPNLVVMLERAVFFLNYVPRGGTYTVSYHARVTTAGEATAPPAKVEAMYEPEVNGRTVSRKVEVGR